MSSKYDIKCKVIEEELRSVWPEWHVAGRLGGGAFGDVFQIYRDNHGIRVDSALKVIQVDSEETAVVLPAKGQAGGETEAASQSDIPDALLGEIQIMEALRGAPNIVAIEDFSFKRDGSTCSLFVRMELLTSIQDSLSGQHGHYAIPSIREICKLGKDVCRALIYCEKKGIIHRDIKPANIFVDRFGDYKVGDFGVSKRIESMFAAQTMTGIGTVSYMAPEIFMRQSYNNTVDIYALGLVLYQILNNGRMPFLPVSGTCSSQDLEKANYRRLQGEPLPVLSGQTAAGENIGGQLDSIIRKACAMNPADRYQTAEEFYNALDDFQDQENGRGAEPGVRTQDIRRKDTNSQQQKENLLKGKKLYVPVIIGIVFLIILGMVILGHRNRAGQSSDQYLSEEKKPDTQTEDTQNEDTQIEEEGNDSEKNNSDHVTTDQATEGSMLSDGIYSATFTTDSSMFHVSEANNGKGVLTVKEGKMTIHVSLGSKNIVNLFVGTSEDAGKEGAAILEPTGDEVTYSGGGKEEVYGFDIPVAAIGEEFDCAIVGKMGKWYDHKVKVSDPIMLNSSGEAGTDSLRDDTETGSGTEETLTAERKEIQSATVLERGEVYEIEQKMNMYAEPSVDSEVVMELSKEWAVGIEEPAEQGNGWYRVSLWLAGQPTYGYIQIP